MRTHATLALLSALALAAAAAALADEFCSPPEPCSVTEAVPGQDVADAQPNASAPATVHRIQVTAGLEFVPHSWSEEVPRPREHSVQRESPAVYASDRHPLLEAVHRAYNTHAGLSVSAADVLYCLMQQFALWQKHEDRHLKEEDRKALTVRRNNFSLEGPNYWAGAFPEFLELMPEARGSPELSVDTPLTLVARAAALMDAFSKRYVYHFMTTCGIPYVDVRGTDDDWRKVLEWTRASPCPEIRAAADTVERAFVRRDAKFWESVYKRFGMSGPKRVDGWILRLFPFYYDGGLKRGRAEERTDDEFPSNGVSSVPFVWTYYSSVLPMQLYAGMAGVAGTDCVRIEYEWEITSEDWHAAVKANQSA